MKDAPKIIHKGLYVHQSGTVWVKSNGKWVLGSFAVYQQDYNQPHKSFKKGHSEFWDMAGNVLEKVSDWKAIDAPETEPKKKVKRETVKTVEPVKQAIN